MTLKQQMVARLTGANALSAAQLSRETGITQQNLSRWLSEARSRPLEPSCNDIVSSWTVEQKAGIIARAAQLAGDRLCAYLHGEGVKLGHFMRWRLALQEAGEASVSMNKRICWLERELVRKERALAELAAMLVLRETIESKRYEDERDSDEQPEAETQRST